MSTYSILPYSAWVISVRNEKVPTIFVSPQNHEVGAWRLVNPEIGQPTPSLSSDSGQFLIERVKKTNICCGQKEIWIHRFSTPQAVLTVARCQSGEVDQ
jgi:hypothetical protein